MLNNHSRYNSIALWSCAIIFCIWAYFIFLRYYSFQYTGWDLALSAQIMWSLCHGSTTTSLIGGNFLIDHANYIAFLLVPFYFFFQSALTLLLLKTFTFFVGSYILYLLTTKNLGPIWGILFMLGYIFFPANTSMFFFEFNFENLAPPLILLAFYLLEEKKIISFLITSLILCLIKENMPLIAMMLGLYATIRYRKEMPRFSRCAAALLLLGGGLFILQMFVIHPQITKEHPSNYWAFYKKLGDFHTPWQIIKNVLFSPQITFPLLFTKRNISFLAQLFGPLLIPVIFSPWILLLGLPLFLQNLLSSFSGAQSIHFYYASSLVVFIFLATIKSLERLKIPQQKYILILIISAIFLFNLTFLKYWCQRIPKPKGTVLGLTTHNIISLIPKDAGIISSYKYLPWLSQRKDLYPLGLEIMPSTRQKMQVPHSVCYALFNPKTHRGHNDIIRKFLSNPQWSILAASENVILMQKNQSQGKPFVQIRQESTIPQAQSIALRLKSFIELEWVNLPIIIPSSSRLFPVTYYWNVLRPLPPHCRVNITITQSNNTIWSNDRPIAYSLPIRRKEYIEDRVYYDIPPLPSGAYEVHIRITRNIRPTSQNLEQQSDVFTQKINVR